MNMERTFYKHSLRMLILGCAALLALSLTACEKKEEVKAPPPPAEVNAMRGKANQFYLLLKEWFSQEDPEREPRFGDQTQEYTSN